MNVGSKKSKIETEQDKILNNISKWKNEMKVSLLKIEERERNRGRGFVKRMKEAWDDIYKNSTMSTQTLKDNTGRFHKDKSLFNLIKLRHVNDVELETIQITLRKMKTMMKKP